MKRASGRPLVVAFKRLIDVKPALGEGGWGAEGGGVVEEGLLVVDGALVLLLPALLLLRSKELSLVDAKARKDEGAAALKKA